MTPELRYAIEILAASMFHHYNKERNRTWSGMSTYSREEWRRKAAACLQEDFPEKE